MKNRIDDYNLSTNFSGIYRGVVEDNQDPEKRLRCKVRIFGLHTSKFEKTDGEGIPTDELPWAEPALPLTGGGASGFGTFGVPLQGTQVFVFFEGGNFLQPRFFGWSPTTTISPPAASKAAAEKAEKSRQAAEENIKTNWDSAPDSIPDSCRPDLAGAVARMFETSCRQPGFVSSGKGDKGGASYGIYQFASNEGAVEEFYKYGMSAEDRKYFDGINPRDWTNPNGKCATAWKKWCTENEDRAFNAQNNYMMSKYYPKMANAFKAQTGIDPSSNRALQEAVISTAVQHGPGASYVFSGLNSSMSTEEMVQAIYKDRSNVETRFKSSPNLWNGLRKRLGCEEPKIVLSMLGSDSVPKSADEAAEKLVQSAPEAQAQNEKEVQLAAFNNPTPPTSGFQDKSGKHPQPNRNDQPAVHRTAQGNTDDTALCHRQKNLEKNIPGVNGQTWSEPEPQAAPVYTNNIVTACENGVMVEMDNTPGAQGYRVTHPSNSYQEFGAIGSIVTRANTDITQISKVNTNINVGGMKTETVMGSTFEKIGGDHIKEVNSENYKIFTTQTIFVGTGKTEVIGVQYDLNVVGKMSERIAGPHSIICTANKTENYAAGIDVKTSIYSLTGAIIRMTAGMIYLN